MVERLFLLVVVIALMTEPTWVSAQAVWEKYAANPVLNEGPPGAWDNCEVSGGTVLYEGGVYKMWYTACDCSHCRIGYATSVDGVVWIEYPGNAVLDAGAPGTWDGMHVASPAVLYEGGTYKMWYQGHDGSGWRIGYATSPDGITWTKYAGNPVLNLGSFGEWDWANVWGPAVLFEGGTYKMWYTGHDASHRRIGYATSLDGATWTKYVGNPVLDIGPPGAWDNDQIHAPTVIAEGDTLKMWYGGQDGSNGRIGYATSLDGATWTKYVGNPVVDIGPAGAWDNAGISNPSVLLEGGSYKMWYTGEDATFARIGYAFSEGGRLVVSIDIKPRSWPNSINPDSKGMIPVAILTTSRDAGESINFDATTVDAMSVRFGPGEATKGHKKGHIQDADGDGDLDMVLHFRTQETGIERGDTEASLFGMTIEGQEFEGTDSVRTVPLGGKRGASPSSSGLALEQPLTDPSNPSEAWIPYILPIDAEVVIRIYNVSGQLIRTLDLSRQSAGEYLTRESAAHWNGRNSSGERVASGVYFYSVEAGELAAGRKMVLVK